MTQKKLVKLVHSGQKWCWLERLGVGNLVAAMELLSGEYGMKWADQWQKNLDDPKWLDKAMKHTFGRLKTEDQELVRPLYEDWKWYYENLEVVL